MEILGNRHGNLTFTIVKTFQPCQPLSVAAIQGQSHVMLIFCVCRPSRLPLALSVVVVVVLAIGNVALALRLHTMYTFHPKACSARRTPRSVPEGLSNGYVLQVG